MPRQLEGGGAARRGGGPRAGTGPEIIDIVSGAEKYLLPCSQAEAGGVSEYPVSAEVRMSPASPVQHDFSSSRHCTVQGKVGLYIIVYIILLLLHITYNIYEPNAVC